MVAGKSNLMDAVSFVMGVKTTDLRGTKVTDFRSHSAKAEDRNTAVTLYYRSEPSRFSPPEQQIPPVLMMTRERKREGYGSRGSWEWRESERYRGTFE